MCVHIGISYSKVTITTDFPFMGPHYCIYVWSDAKINLTNLANVLIFYLHVYTTKTQRTNVASTSGYTLTH